MSFFHAFLSEFPSNPFLISTPQNLQTLKERSFATKFSIVFLYGEYWRLVVAFYLFTILNFLTDETFIKHEVKNPTSN